MPKKEILCSLYVLNLKTVSRAIGDSILGPNKGNLCKFSNFKQISSALKLEKNNAIKIKTEIPQHIVSQLDDSETVSVSTVKENDIDSEETVEDSEEGTDEKEAIEDETIEDSEETIEDSEDEAIEIEDEKPEWYLSYSDVEGMTKKQLVEWIEVNEEVTLPKNKNAEETKTLIHKFLSEKFEDHAE